MRYFLLSITLISSFYLNSEVEKLIEQQCSSCHDNKSLNLVSISSMSQYSELSLLDILETGKMKTQAESLSSGQKAAIAKYLAEQNQSYVQKGYSNPCKNKLSVNDLKKGSKWTSWGHDSFNTRYQSQTNINSTNLNKLKLKWSFGLEETDARAQPIAVGEIIVISGKSLHALNKETGCEYWSFKPYSGGIFRNSPTFDTDDEDSIYAVDSNFIVYKINILNGSIIWEKDHQFFQSIELFYL